MFVWLLYMFEMVFIQMFHYTHRYANTHTNHTPSRELRSRETVLALIARQRSTGDTRPHALLRVPPPPRVLRF